MVGSGRLKLNVADSRSDTPDGIKDLIQICSEYDRNKRLEFVEVIINRVKLTYWTACRFIYFFNLFPLISDQWRIKENSPGSTENEASACTVRAKSRLLVRRRAGVNIGKCSYLADWY